MRGPAGHPDEIRARHDSTIDETGVDDTPTPASTPASVSLAQVSPFKPPAAAAEARQVRFITLEPGERVLLTTRGTSS